MSSLWTPDGEHRVGRSPVPGPDPDSGDRSGAESALDPEDLDGLDEEALRDEIARARARVAEAPPEVVVLNHAMGLYELGAIHLSSSPPDLVAAALAIDAFGCLVEGLGERLGPDSATLRDALAQIRLAFVQIKGAAGAAGAPAAEGAPGPPEAPGSEEPAGPAAG